MALRALQVNNIIWRGLSHWSISSKEILIQGCIARTSMKINDSANIGYRYVSQKCFKLKETKGRPKVDEWAIDRCMKERKFEAIEPQQFFDELAPFSDPHWQITRRNIVTVINEYEYAKCTPHLVPSTLTSDNIKVLLKKLGRSFDDRMRYLGELYERERKEIELNLKKMEAKKVVEARKEIRRKDYVRSETTHGLWDENGNPFYGLWRNTMFTRFLQSSIRRGGSASRLRRAALFEPSIVFDFSWEKVMHKQIIYQTMASVAAAYSSNRHSFDCPFNLWFVNLKKNSKSERLLKKIMNFLDEPQEHFINITEEHYLKVFPKERLVYLSPDAETSLHKIDPDDIYIIGALQDKHDSRPYTAQRAKIEDIRRKKLPLAKYVPKDFDYDNLAPDRVLKILLKVKHGKSWQEAIETSVKPREP